MSQKQEILIALSDGKWHSMVELNDICFRYGGRLHELRQEGIKIAVASGRELYDLRIVSKPYTATFHFYRLTTPKDLIDFDRCALKAPKIDSVGQIGMVL